MELARRHWDGVARYCPSGHLDETAVNELEILNAFLQKYGALRDPGRESAVHGLPASLRNSFLNLPPASRTSYLNAVRSEMKNLEANHLRPEATVLAHLPLSDGFEFSNFTSDFLQAQWLILELTTYVKAAGERPPGDFGAKVLKYQRAIIGRLEQALHASAPTGSADEVAWAREQLLSYYQLAGARGKSDEMLGRAIDLGTELARLKTGTGAGANAASIVFLAQAALSPAGRSEKLAVVNSLAADVVDEKRNPEWRSTSAFRQAHHHLGVAAMNAARIEALKPEPLSLDRKRAEAIAHLSKVDDPALANYENARYQLALMHLESSHGTRVSDALGAVEGLIYPKWAKGGEWNSLDPKAARDEKNASSVSAYLRAKLLQGRLLILANQAEKVPALLARLEKEIVEDELKISDAEILGALARLQPKALIQEARTAHEAGNFTKAIELARKANEDLEGMAEKLWQPNSKEPGGHPKQRDILLELDVQDLNLLVLRAKIRAGHGENTGLSAYSTWLDKEKRSAFSARWRHNRFLANMDLELGRLSGKEGARAREQYRAFFRALIGGGMGEAWRIPRDLLETKAPDVVEKLRFVGEGFAALGARERAAGEVRASQRDHAAAAELFRAVGRPSLADFSQIFSNLADADSQLANAKTKEAREKWQREKNHQQELHRNMVVSVRDRQAIRTRSLTQHRLASGGDPTSPEFEKAERLLEEMQKIEMAEEGAMGRNLVAMPNRNYFAHIVNLEQEWRMDPMSADEVWKAQAESEHDGREFSTTRQILPVPVTPKATREKLLERLGGNKLALERELDAYWFGRWDLTARKESGKLWRDAAAYVERNHPNDDIMKYRHYGAAASALNRAMTAWNDGAGYTASDWASRGWKKAKADAAFYEDFEAWMDHQFKWGAAVNDLKARRPGDVKVTELTLREGMQTLLEALDQIKASDENRWNAHAGKYSQMYARVRAILEASDGRLKLAAKGFLDRTGVHISDTASFLQLFRGDDGGPAKK